KESANDNASGSAALLDIAMTIHRLIEQGRLDRPRRTLRFLWVPEWKGTMAYIDKHPEMMGPELGGKVLVNFNMDMVGENLELLHSHLVLTRTPESLPSVANDVIADMARMVDGMDIRTPRGSLSDFNYRITPYSGGSDHMMFIDRKVPGIMFNHTDYTHHTSEDTPDKVDPVEIERCEIIAAGAALYLSNLSPRQARDLTLMAAANAHQRLALDGRSVIRRVGSADDPAKAWAEANNRLEHSLMREAGTLQSVLNFTAGTTVAEEVQLSVAGLQTHYRELTATLARAAQRRGVERATPPPLTESPDVRIPVRLTRGPLDFDLPASQLPPGDAAWYDSSEFPLDGAARFELVNFIDGERTVTAIRNALSAEFGPVDQIIVTRYLNDLVRAEVLKWK
ncbi:MAG: M28 family peptidase, partial [Candidatus Neomarinimicrobiota bacterium]